MRFSIKTLLFSILLIAVLMVAYLAFNPSRVDVEFATAKRGPLRVSVVEDGKTRIREKYTVSTPVSGRVSRIELDPGDYCNEKTLLAVILPGAPAMLDARAHAEAGARMKASASAVERSKSSSEQAKIRVDLNASRFERAKKLLPTGSVSSEEFEIIKSELLASQQALETARFDEEISKFELQMAAAAVKQFSEEGEQSSVEPFEIYAPVSGQVLRVLQESSAVVAVGTPLIEVGDPRNLEIEIDVLSTDAVRIKQGNEITVDHWGGGAPLTGYVRVVEPAAFTKISSLGVEEQRVNVIADFNESPDRIASLGDGYRVEARITVNELANVLLVPNSALFRHQRSWHVLSIVDEKANLQPVSIGLQSDSHTQITEGLSEGDRVIVYPSEAIKHGTRVQAMPSE